MAIAIEFDFKTKRDREIPVEETRASLGQGLCCWIDVDLSDHQAAESALTSIGLNRVVIDEVLSHPVIGRYDVYDDCLHVSVAAARSEAGRFSFSHMDLIIGERLLITLHRGPMALLDLVRGRYQDFFQKFAKSLGFLLFDIWDKLIDSYRRGLADVEEEVEQLQKSIYGDVSDDIFNRVGDTTHNLLLLRKHILAAREVLHQLAVKKTSFISEVAQSFLNNMVGTLERLGSDLTVEREILAETVNLYMGIVNHKTNKVVTQLTVITVIFLPLTFLCGVYGMNFEILPELHWEYGYAMFWGIVTLIVGSLLYLIRKRRWM